MSDLFKAIKSQDFPRVQHLIEDKGVNPYEWNGAKVRSTFHLACEHFKSGEILEFLVEKAALQNPDLNSQWHQRGPNRRFPHHILASRAENHDQVTDTFKFLSQYLHLDFEAIDQFHETSLDIAKNAENQVLVTYLEQFTRNDSSTIWKAINANDVTWLENNLNPDQVNTEGPGGTCLQYATKLNHVSTVSFLLTFDSIDINLTSTSNPFPPVFEAALQLNPQIFEMFLQRANCKVTQKIRGDDDAKRWNLMHALLAGKKEYHNEIDWLKNPIDWQLVKDTHALLKLFFELRSPEEVALLINEQDYPRKNTPLHYATEHQGQELAKLLLKHGAEKSLFVLNKNEDIPISHMDTQTVREFLDRQISFEGSVSRSDFKLTLHADYFFPNLLSKENYDDGNSIEMGAMLDEHFKADEPKKDIPELDYLGRIKDVHRDLFDHPIISSIIWRKWQKVWRFFVFLSAIKFSQHICGITYVMSAYGGASLHCHSSLGLGSYHNDSNNLFCSKTCCPDMLRNYSWFLFMVTWTLNLCRSSFILMILARRDLRITWGNWYTIWEQGESKLTSLNNLVIVPLMALTKDEPFNRDVSGFYILVACFDICFIMRNHLSNRSLAAMVTWTEVVSRSIFNFFKVHVILLIGFMLTFYIQLHDDVLDEDGQQTESSEPFHFYYKVPLKTFAMFVGELEYGDFPFQTGKFLIFNHLTFLLFVYFIVLVMMNLLTGMALMDVQEISNASSDLTWMEMMVKINYIEEFLVTYNACKWGDKFKVFNSNRKLVMYPNKKSPNWLQRYVARRFRDKTEPFEEVLVGEESIKSEAKRIVQEMIDEQEKAEFC